MKIIVSPAKKMTDQEDFFEWDQLPVFLDQANAIKDYLKALTYDELKRLWQCNDKIAHLNVERLQNMDLHKGLVPALLAYEGLQYQYMAPQVFDLDQWAYVRKHLVILSGFYGYLRPTDGVVTYRLEMGARFDPPLAGSKNLYQYWDRRIYEELTSGGSTIVNLASKEYSQAIEKFLTVNDRLITCVFGNEIEVDGELKVKVKATEAKMARGEMVRYLAEHQITDPALMKGFSSLNYRFSEKHSSPNRYVFIKGSSIK